MLDERKITASRGPSARDQFPRVVTGASSGIGAATVRSLGAAGASVLLVGRDEGRLNQQVANVAAAGGRGVAAIVDLTDAEAAAGLVDRAVEEFGSLHGMVLAASLFDPSTAAGLPGKAAGDVMIADGDQRNTEFRKQARVARS